MKRFFVFAMFLWTGIMGVSAQEDRFDLNRDGQVTVTDIIMLTNYVLGKKEYVPGEAVDLGLPSGTKWASCNVGATKPEEYGGYYAWGETEEKEIYTEDNYKYYQNDSLASLGSDISGTEYDVAHMKWGGNWCMPTLDDIKELRNNCTSEWTTLNGVNGRKFTGPNGNSIFLPAAGNSWYGDLRDAGSYGNYRSSNYSGSAYCLYFSSGGAIWYGSNHNDGRSVRPVYKNVPAKAIDLGLPSGTKWASCNVGASKPEEYGGYYAWGETEEKDYYDWSTYIHCDGSRETCHDLGSDISGTEYDVAHVKWGGNWVMPSQEQQQELLDNCTSEWTTLNGVNGRKFTGPNGNSIFLPAAGYRRFGNFYYTSSRGYYWSCTQRSSGSDGAYNLDFDSGYTLRLSSSSLNGFSVRPVVRN